MSLHVVVYAEGAGDLGRSLVPPPAPARWLEEHDLGPAHVLAGRSIQDVRGVPAKAIRFAHGLRKANTAVPRGSDFLQKRTLLRLLDWPRDDMRPELAIVFVDEDDDRKRHPMLSGWVAELRHGRPPTVIAVARQEFEAWLVTDRSCVAEVLGHPMAKAGNPEDWEPKAAKELLQAAIDASGVPDMHAARREISARCDLEVLKRESRSFARFLSDLRA